MRASALKIGRSSVVLACTANSFVCLQQRRRQIQPSLQCETQRPAARRVPSAHFNQKCRFSKPTYCETPLHWRPGFQFNTEYDLQLDRELGHGGCGQVFLAVHNSSGVSRAVKRVEKNNAFAAQALQQELEVMQKLRGCAHVVQIIDAFEDESYHYVVMELCYGLDLVDAIMEIVDEDDSAIDANNHLSHIAAVFREMVKGVAECHANKVYHMDIKPENFIHVSTGSVDDSPSIKLLDFGLASVNVDQMSISPNTRLGCSKYLAPEAFNNGTKIVTPDSVDMYALGVSLFNLFNGQFPYEYSRTGRPRSRPDLSEISDPDARDLIGKLLSPDPAQRPKTNEVLQHPFLQTHAGAQVLPLSELKRDSSKSQRLAMKGLQEVELKRKLDDKTRAFLKRAPLFRDASDELLDMIVAGSDRAFFSPGDTVLEDDAEKMPLHIVQDGLLEVHRGGSKSSAEFVGPGELVGETALLFGQQPVGESLKALKPTTTVVLDRSEFALILNEFPKERDIIMKTAEWRCKEMGVAASI